MREFFVDPLNGSKNNNGSPANPLLDLQTWADNAQRGDHVIVRTAPGRLVPGFSVHVPEVLIETDGESADVTAVPAPGRINAIRIDCPPNTQADNPTLVRGFKVKGGSQAGIFVVNCPRVVVQHNTVTDVGAWGIHVGSSNGCRVWDNVVARVAEQHGIYVCNSTDDFEVLRNHLYHLWLQGIHVNGDLKTSRDIGMTNPTGYMTNGVVGENVIYLAGSSMLYPQQPNKRRGGVGIDADSCEKVLYRNNKILSLASGINVATSQGNPCRLVQLIGNVIDSQFTCINLNDAPEDVTVKLNTLANAKGSYRDSADNILPVRLVWDSSNVQQTTPAFAVADLNAMKAAFDPMPEPPPVPPPPPAPVVVVPPVPATAPAGVPAVDGVYDAAERGTAYWQEWNDRRPYGTDFKFAGLGPVPWEFMYQTPVGGIARGEMGVHVLFAWKATRSGVAQFRFTSRGTADATVGGLPFDLEPITSGNDVATDYVPVTVEVGRLYPAEVWLSGGDVVTLARLEVRFGSDEEFKRIPDNQCYPPVARPAPGVVVPPVPPVPPVPTPIPDPGTGPKPGPTPAPGAGNPFVSLSSLTAEQLADLQRLGMLPRW
jgi:hypothetical protein